MSKIYTLRFRAVNEDIFQAIKNGKKKVETRAGTIKFRNIKKGDILKFVCGGKSFEKKIARVTVFKTIPELIKKYKIKEINPAANSAEDLIKIYYSFPGYKEKIKEFGLIAMELN